MYTMECQLGMEGQKKLLRHRDGRVANPGILRLGRYRPNLDVVHENELVQHIKNMDNALSGLTPHRC